MCLVLIFYVKKNYTKLSRLGVLQYDTVSDRVITLFPEFLNFLICEGFGFKLFGPGNFYFLFMYFISCY